MTPRKTRIRPPVRRSQMRALCASFVTAKKLYGDQKSGESIGGAAFAASAWIDGPASKDNPIVAKSSASSNSKGVTLMMLPIKIDLGYENCMLIFFLLTRLMC